MKSKSKNTQHSLETKDTAVRLVMSGLMRAEVVRRLQIPESTLRRWLQTAEKAECKQEKRPRRSSVCSVDSTTSTDSSSSSNSTTSLVVLTKCFPIKDITASGKKRKHKSTTFKDSAVRLVISGLSQAEVVRRLKVPESTLRGWLRVVEQAGLERTIVRPRSRQLSVCSAESTGSTDSSASSSTPLTSCRDPVKVIVTREKKRKRDSTTMIISTRQSSRLRRKNEIVCDPDAPPPALDFSVYLAALGLRPK